MRRASVPTGAAGQGDAAPGRGVEDVRSVLTPDGTAVTDPAAPTPY